MATLYLTHEDCLEHDTGTGHPERPDRLRAVYTALEHEIFERLVRKDAPLGEIAAVARIHPNEYIEAIQEAVPEEGLVRIDADTVLSPNSLKCVMRAVGAGMHAVDQVIEGKTTNAFCAVRPPGHHAEPDRAMGFCVFNSIAVAGLHARAKHGAERIAVVDFDVHHGNGTQASFWSDKDLFYASTHQMPLFPGSGALSETGVGNIFNAPLSPGDSGDHFREAFETRILPSLQNFSPDILLISAGFDAHQRDPLANIGLVEDDFAWATRKLAEIADKRCDRRIVSMLEGGYDLEGLAKSVAVHVNALMEAGS